MNNKVARELRKKKRENLFPSFWAYNLAVFSMIHGFFLLIQVDFIMVPLQNYFFGVNEDIFGWLLLIAGVGKIIGEFYKIHVLKRISIVILSGVWGMLFYTSLFWSFGMGYPDNAFIDTALMLVMSLRVSYKGV